MTPLSPSEQTLVNRLRKGPADTEELVNELYGYRSDGGPEFAANCVLVSMRRIERRHPEFRIRKVWMLEET
ncbi:MAG TPA: hypothetical protein ENH62_09010 [Marinobacter sp.]|uniref:Uncharacterized protein n=1 Tax=marine sediment metagenome TaxID=412755 RepID=A0A0F9N287_9ZZZZ|nr:hypothetical protein [Marinobacter sp.]